MSDLLREMGHTKTAPVFFQILGAYDTGNWKLASYHAESVIQLFDELAAQIRIARRSGMRAESTDLLPDTSLQLKEYIAGLDEAESKRKLVILAVDDSPPILQSVSSVLSTDYKVYTLVKPTELERILEQITPELFLLDYQMPEINGFELVPIIRGRREHKDTPIVFLTSDRSIDSVTAAIALGACDFVVKPYEPDVLRQKIARHIVRKKNF